jgi:Flp pilus assembly pilin Flp
MSRFLKLLFFDEEAATAVEYAVMLALILLAALGSTQLFGTTQQSMWLNIDNSLDANGMSGGGAGS